MIKVAHENGASLVKFQLFDAEDDKGTPHYDWVKAHELTFEQAKQLFDYGKRIGQEVFFSVFGIEYVKWCERIGVNHIKVSATMSDLKVIKAVDHSGIFYISSHDRKYFIAPRNGDAFLYCPEGYPQDVNFLHLKIWFRDRDKDNFDGFSDHTIGIDAAKIALARGAQIIEKHFVLAHDPQYPDDVWSMTPSELKELIRWDKLCHEVLG